MTHHKFDIRKLERLNDPGRFESLPPDVFFSALELPEGSSVIVEIGAGTGLFAEEFTVRAPGATVYVTDIAEEALEWIRANRSGVAGGRIVPVMAEETCVPLPDEFADAVYMINIHHELVDPAATYADAFRLLKPGGRLLVVDWAVRETPKGPPAISRVTAETLTGIVCGAGFSDVKVDEDRLVWHIMATATRPRE
ncbi:MAG: class I SAM-dependent methyltransferase [Coriobacteriia bacterium]|nr:class I SAM-dependent methyltransferase [Coriobacteriia bacterium]